MEIVSISIFKVDVSEAIASPIQLTNRPQELTNYLNSLINIIVSEPSGREYLFTRDTTEVRGRISSVGNITNGEAVISQTIANRLLDAEATAQNRIEHLGKEIQKGVLIQALVDIDGINKFVICKADHTEFLNDNDFSITFGLPIKKKIFKAFICDYSTNGEINGNSIVIYDTNPVHSHYWWHDFLELQQLRSDEDNTETAFKKLDKHIFNKIRKTHPQEYLELHNSSLRYFRANEAFDIEQFIEGAIGNYTPPEGSTFNVEEWKTKIRELPEKHNFDRQFGIIKSKITAKMKTGKVELTPQIDLNFKEDIPNISDIIHSELREDGNKYVVIKSPKGYEYFEKIMKNGNQ